jgi:hypothetical protein
MALVTSLTMNEEVYPKAYIKLQHYEQTPTGVLVEFVVFADYDFRVELSQPLTVINFVCPNIVLSGDASDTYLLYEEFKNLHEDLVFEQA